jgi:phage gp46-like protein
MSDFKAFHEPLVLGEFITVKYSSDDAGFVGDDTFETAVRISVLSDAKVSDEDAPDGQVGGFWAEDLLGYNLGSKLHLLKRKKLNNTTLRLAEQYTVESVQWLIDEGAAKSATAIASKVSKDRMGIVLEIEQPDNVTAEFAFAFNWNSQFGRAA